MTVIQINCVYPGGSTGGIVRAIHRHLQARGIRSLVLYGRGPRKREPGVTKVCPEWCAKGNALLARVRGVPYGGCLLSTARIQGILQREQPDIVHLHCVNGHFLNTFRLLSWLKQHKIPTVITLHAEFFYTGTCGNARDCRRWELGCGQCPRLRQETGSIFPDRTARSHREMAEAFRDFGETLRIVSVSPWVRSRAERSPILRNARHETIPNGVDCGVFRPGGRASAPAVFHATPLFSDSTGHLKGGCFVLELARRMPETPFFVAGKTKLKHPLPPNVTLLGQIPEQEILARHYAAAAVTLLTSASETFSLVCAESLCCGTPVVGFRCGGPESVFPPECCDLVPYADLDALEAALRHRLAHPIRVDVGARFSQEAMAARYEALYREVCPDA